MSDGGLVAVHLVAMRATNLAHTRQPTCPVVAGRPPTTIDRMIGFIIAGLIIGLLARLILPGKQHIGILWTLALGVLGSVIGGTIANLIGTGDIFELNVIGFIVAVIASVGLLAVAERSGLGAGDDRQRLNRG